MQDTPRSILEALFRAAVTAADPVVAVNAALEKTQISAAGRLFLLALGKASPAMADAALAWSRERGKPMSGGVVVSTESVSQKHPPLIHFLTGDHPIPGDNSLRAADAVDKLSRELRNEDEVWVLLSGGTSSLVGAPVPGVAPADFVQLFQLLLASGLDIRTMNLVRKRVSRWGAGRLALALSPARVRVFAISDVANDDLAIIGSGPCAPDPTSAAELRTLLGARGLWQNLPNTIGRYIDEVMAGLRGETPKFDDPRFSRVHSRVLANTQTALAGAVDAAKELGLGVSVEGQLSGDATVLGSDIAGFLVEAARRGRQGVFLWGGETTVTLELPSSAPERISRPARPRLGGRCQDLALSAAIRLAEAQVGERITLLAAGTDGRDGPTDAAGAIVDGTTAARVGNPRDHLERHDAYPALNRAKSLLVTGSTGTNVRDVVIGLIRDAPRPPADSPSPG
jgi:glycerate 2-kinase